MTPLTHPATNPETGECGDPTCPCHRFAVATGDTKTMRRIYKRSELQQLAKDLKVRPDWHEPDEQGLDAFTFGGSFDNAGHWGLEYWSRRELDTRTRLYKAGDSNTVSDFIIEDAERFMEMFVVLYQEGHAVAEINLATLLAFACGTYEG